LSAPGASNTDGDRWLKDAWLTGVRRLIKTSRVGVTTLITDQPMPEALPPATNSSLQQHKMYRQLWATAGMGKRGHSTPPPLEML